MTIPKREIEIANDLITHSLYKPLGRGPIELDCYGLVLEGCHRLGVPIPYDPLIATHSARELANLIKEADKVGNWQSCMPSTGAVAVYGSVEFGRHVGFCIAGGILDISENGTQFRLYRNVNEKVVYKRWVG